MMNQKLKVVIDSHLRISDPLPERVRELLWDALTFGKPEGDGTPGDPTIFLMRSNEAGETILPRGFAYRLKKTMPGLGYDVEWEDRRVRVPIELPSPPNLGLSYEPRPYQIKAMQRMLAVEQGIYEGPAGSGKTITTAFFISETRQRTLVIVDKINIARQWRDRIHDVLGTTPTLIGDGAWEESDITIATRQSLWARREQLDASGWWATWGAVVYDEVHQISAETVRELLQRFPAYFRIGLSATPDRHDWLTHASRSIVGEIFCRTSREELAQAGVLVKPEIVAVRTPLIFDWQRRASKHKEWQRLVSKLREDEGRNRLITRLLDRCRGHAVLVHTDQLKHARELSARALADGWADESVLMLTGDQGAEERDRVRERASEGDCVIFSTIGKEALDIPRLDRILLVWPTKNATAVQQLIGRIERTHDAKAPPVVFDLYDNQAPPLDNHFAMRRGVYERRGLKLSFEG